MYDEIFAVSVRMKKISVVKFRGINFYLGVFILLQKEDPAKNNPRFWDELFLMKV